MAASTTAACDSVPAPLRYVDSSEPGIRRLRCGKGFTYKWPDGSTVRDERERARIAALAIPPAWTDVWICTDSNGHLLATGRDDRGRKQYVYHPAWREARDAVKYDGLVAFGECLPRVRRRVRRDLRAEGLPRHEVLAAVVRLLDQTYLRIGNESYASENDSYGLTTLRDRHVDVDGATIRIDFDGKGGQHRCVALDDPLLAEIVAELQELPGQRLFQFLDENDEPHSIDSADVNEYLRDIAGAEISAKDFRTWAATVTAAVALQLAGECEPPHRQAIVRGAYDQAAAVLGNTPAVCKSSYVDPRVTDAYLEGTLCADMDRCRKRVKKGKRPRELLSEEAVVLEYLRSLH